MLGENDGLARGEVQRLLDGGFLHEFSSFEELKEYVMGDPLLNKLGLLIKEKSDGTVKLRLITDPRASMGNEFLTIPERIVLPRLQDAVEMILFLLHGLEEEQSAGGAQGASVVVGFADIKDAFLNVPVLPSERRAQCYRIWDKWATSDSLVFGAGPSPLLWGRVAAWAARTAQGLFDFNELPLQLYVDDPLWAVKGTPEQEQRHCVTPDLFRGSLDSPQGIVDIELQQ